MQHRLRRSNVSSRMASRGCGWRSIVYCLLARSCLGVRAARCVVAPGVPLERRESRDGKSLDLTRMHGSGKCLALSQFDARCVNRAPCVLRAVAAAARLAFRCLASSRAGKEAVSTKARRPLSYSSKRILVLPKSPFLARHLHFCVLKQIKIWGVATSEEVRLPRYGEARLPVRWRAGGRLAFHSSQPRSAYIFSGPIWRLI
jgi:hypothetical protein